MSIVLPVLTTTDYVFQGKTFRIRYMGLDSAGLPYYTYYTGLGWVTRTLQSLAPPTARIYICDILSMLYICTDYIDIYSTTATEMTFDFVGVTTGSISFTSVPTGAEIFLDGADQGVKTPFTVTGIPAGSHTYSLKLAGYNDATGSITVVSGSTIQVYSTLSPIPAITGSISFTSVPRGAEVFLDGADQGVKTPFTVTGIPAGSHTFTLKLAGYNDATGSITVVGGSTVQASANLTMISGATGTSTGAMVVLALLGIGVLGAVVYASRETKPEYTGYSGG